MASEAVTSTPVATTDVIEVPAESKTIIIDPPADKTIIPEVVPATNGDATAVSTTEVPEGEKPVEKPVVDPRQNPVEWISSLIPAGVHKVNHHILSWIQDVTYPTEAEKQPLPGKNEAVTKNQFINFLKDGTLLAKFANTLSPGSIEKVYDGDEAKVKENQVANVSNFVNFVKEKAGLTEAEVFSVDDLQEKGKSGYKSVFNTLFQLGLKAQEQFNANGINVDAIIEAASTAVKHSIVQTIFNWFKRVRPQLNSKAETSEDKTASTPVANGTNGVVSGDVAVAPTVTTTTSTTTNVVPVVATSNGDAKVAEDIPPPVPVSAAPAITA